MCKEEWKKDFLSWHEQLPFFRDQRTMGVRHSTLRWSKDLWTHRWIDPMYAYVAKWGTLGRLSCPSLHESHVRLKRMLRNSGTISL